jgi:predicted MPP superfamily phosphohydrolase
MNPRPQTTVAGVPIGVLCPRAPEIQRAGAVIASSNMSTVFRWIHISDIHMGHGGRTGVWDQRLVLDELRIDVARQIKARPEPAVDAVLVTGDVANTGAGRDDQEYVEAAAWLTRVGEAAGVGRDRIFVVPGNHDVDWGADGDSGIAELVGALRSGECSLDDAIGSPDARAKLEKRMEKYLAFARAFGPTDAAGRLFWSHRFVARSGMPVRLVGLNTALLAAGGDDHGKLRVGVSQIGAALADVDGSELVLALGHHPLQDGWLADQADLEPHLSRRVHALLTGHVHVANAEESRRGSGAALLRIMAGAAHGDAMPPGIPAGHGYSFGEVGRAETGESRLVILPRKWSAKNADYRTDVDNTLWDRDYSEHALPSLVISPAATAPSAAGAPATRATTGAVPGRLVPVFVSSAPEEDDLRRALLSHLTPLRRQGKIEIKHSQEAIGDRRAWIREQVDRALVILLLLSPGYVGSDDYYEDELLHAISRHEQGQAVVVPLRMRRFYAYGMPFERLQPLPRDREPVDLHPRGRDSALASIAWEVSRIIARLRAEPEPPER